VPLAVAPCPIGVPAVKERGLLVRFRDVGTHLAQDFVEIPRDGNGIGEGLGPGQRTEAVSQLRKEHPRVRPRLIYY